MFVVINLILKYPSKTKQHSYIFYTFIKARSRIEKQLRKEENAKTASLTAAAVASAKTSKKVESVDSSRSSTVISNLAVANPLASSTINLQSAGNSAAKSTIKLTQNMLSPVPTISSSVKSLDEKLAQSALSAPASASFQASHLLLEIYLASSFVTTANQQVAAATALIEEMTVEERKG